MRRTKPPDAKEELLTHAHALTIITSRWREPHEGKGCHVMWIPPWLWLDSLFLNQWCYRRGILIKHPISWACSNPSLHHRMQLYTFHLNQWLRLERWFHQENLSHREITRCGALTPSKRRLGCYIFIGGALTHLHISRGQGDNLWTSFHIIFHNPP